MANSVFSKDGKYINLPEIKSNISSRMIYLPSFTLRIVQKQKNIFWRKPCSSVFGRLFFLFLLY